MHFEKGICCNMFHGIPLCCGLQASITSLPAGPEGNQQQRLCVLLVDIVCGGEPWSNPTPALCNL